MVSSRERIPVRVVDFADLVRDLHAESAPTILFSVALPARCAAFEHLLPGLGAERSRRVFCRARAPAMRVGFADLVTCLRAEHAETNLFCKARLSEVY